MNGISFIIFAVNRTKNRDGQRDKTAKHGNQLISARICRLKVIYRVTGKGKSDNGNRRSDDDGRHELINPFYADKLHDNGNDHIDKSCEYRAEDKAEIAERHCGRSRKCGRHGTEKCKG